MGNAIKMAIKLTHKVPRINGKAPNCTAGFAVGNHSFSDKNCDTEILSTLISFPANLGSRYFFENTAIIPGSLFTNESILCGRNSKFEPISSSEK